MASITSLEAKTRFGELLDRVARGEEVVITRHDKPIARLVPEGRASLVEIRNAAAGLRTLQGEVRARSKTGPALSWKEVKSAIAEGRK